MKFRGIKATWQRRVGGALCAALVTLAGCGGGTQVERFVPNRILSFGDENNVINQDTTAGQVGAKYTVNAFTLDSAGNATTTINCAADPLWIQSVAGAFNLVFAECPGTATTTSGQILAQAGADVAAVQTQVDNFLATGQFTSKDIVTIMAGQNDLLALYAQYPTTSADDLATLATARGKALADVANRIAVTGAKVIITRIPDLGFSPFAKSEDAANGAGRAALLTRLTTAFNVSMQLNLINDGHLIGLVFGDAVVQSLVQFPAAYGLVNVDSAVCQNPAVSALLGCTTSSLIATPDAAGNTVTATDYLWAGNWQLGPTAQSSIGASAASRAVNNPF